MKNHISIATLIAVAAILPPATTRAADPPKVSSGAIVEGLKKKPLTRSIGVAAKPEVSIQGILFKFGTTEIEGDTSFAQLRELGKALENPTLKNAVIEVQGHTDNVGTDESNQKLSEQRAQKIVQELQRHYTLSVSRVIPSGKGEAEPAAGSKDQQTDAERAQNRRVVVKRLDQ